LIALDLGGTFIFALSGSVLAVSKSYDVVGVAALGLVAGLGGGVVRDVLLGVQPPRALTEGGHLAAVFAAVALSYGIPHIVSGISSTVVVLDAIGLAFFASLGTSLGRDAGLSPVPAVLIGVVTAVGGGLGRDLLALETPRVLHEEVYALAAVLSGALVLVLPTVGLSTGAAAPVAITVGVVVRLVAWRNGWDAPRPRMRRNKSTRTSDVP
jgi:uncharacterized membrane protein YeiH